MGSKNRHAREILSIIPYSTGQLWVEPFVGGANIIDKIKGPRIGADINKYLIAMWHALQEGWIPPENISEEEYNQIRNTENYCKPELYAFVAIGCSYAGKWWGGFARGEGRNYCRESRDNVLKQVPKLKDVKFICSDYQSLYIPPKSLIYADPPYANVTDYKNKFDHNLFWQWANQKIKEGHDVYVSEYLAPSDWKCIWAKKVNNTLVQNTGSKQGIERLFTKE
jgi:DNA adenine methylase